ncbi:DAK2 domain-containing protein [Nocardia sp. NPDC058633]|uniref:DAK2 domain-containing protein n=1 Tax=Nocardia sp. NPDC058633 TaxID=3346568 RepID=UPI003664108E
MAVSHVRESLDGPDLLVWARSCRTGLELRRAEIDALNVFPIADSDTGTNLLATMRAAVATADRAVLEATSGTPERQVGLGALDRDPSCPGDHDAKAAIVDGPSAHLIARALARGATTGARGNSGIILSQVLRGIAEAVVDGPLTGERLRVALRRSAVLVRTGLSAPVEGTILTVLDRAAVAAAESPDRSLVTVARSAADGAARALSETPAQLGVLRAAGVVDAGARGLLVLLDCLVAEVCGEAPERVRYTRGERADHGPHRRPGSVHEDDNAERVDDAPDSRKRRASEGASQIGAPVGPGSAPHRRDPATQISSVVPRAGDDVHDRATDSIRRSGPGDQEGRTPDFLDDRDHREHAADPHFEVMYVISGTDEAAAGGLRDRLAVLGDSVVVVGDGESTWSAHVHCRDAGAAIEAGLAVGTLTGIRIESFAVTAPHDATHHAHDRDDSRDHPGVSEPRTGDDRAPGSVVRDVATGDDLADRGVLAVVGGSTAVRLFEDAGAVVLRGDRHLDTSTLLRAIRAMPNREVLVLPNGALPAQELVAVGVAARDGSRDVLLLPSSSMVQGLAALAVHDRGRIAVDDAFAMSEAAATTRWGALRAARVRALTMVGMCSPGDGLGLVGHDVVVIDPDVVGAGRILLDRMLGLGGELVTLLMGADAGRELAQVLADHVTAGFPGVEVVVYSGGQQADLVQIGVE